MTYLSELKKVEQGFITLLLLKKDEDIIIKHFLDSLLYLKAFPEGELKTYRCRHRRRFSRYTN